MRILLLLLRGERTRSGSLPCMWVCVKISTFSGFLCHFDFSMGNVGDFFANVSEICEEYVINIYFIDCS